MESGLFWLEMEWFRQKMLSLFWIILQGNKKNEYFSENPIYVSSFVLCKN